ncbi:MAG TPA: peptidylprolyl isomerase [Kofleriaceae bacterium]|nr:peptidylprolyl isomerase [Kofleriaceae bacterium]
MARWTAIAREPLVHFALIGAALFAIDRAVAADDVAAVSVPTAAPPAPAPGSRTIVVDAAARAQIAATAQRQLGRVPSEPELAAATERWIDDEVLYREALARGLDRDDPVIRERIASRMAYVLEQAVALPEPTDAELRAWFDAHRERWTSPEHVDFTHVFVAGSDAAAEARLDELSRALAAGAAPERLGDRFTGGHRYRGRKLADLALAFGDEFAAGLAAQPAGTWVRRRSRHGLHLVRIDRVDAAHDADFAAARLDVRKQWLDAHRADALAAAMQRIRAGWTIERR